jgi:putative membrane protein
MYFGRMHEVGWGGGWEVLMIIGMVAFWILVVAVVVAVIRGGWGWGSRTPQPSQSAVASPAPTVVKPPESALDILKRRYAAGEIDKAEFDAKKHDLLE